MCKRMIFVILVMLLLADVGLLQAAAPVGATISLYSTFTDFYVEMDPGRDNGLIALDSTTVGTYEQFIVEDAGGGNILLKSVANSMYARADVEDLTINNPLRAETTSTTDELAHYEWVENGDGTITLRCIGNSLYVRVQGVNQYLKATKTIIDVDTKFTVDIIVAAAQASEPYPPDGATGVSINADLSWTAGAYATSHDVYFGTDSTPDAGEFMGNQPGTTYDLPQLDLATTYYWQIDEVDTGNPESPWVGNVWSFTTQTGTAVLKKGPYLIYPGTNTQMQVLWQLDSSDSCSIEWGLDTSYSDGSASVPEYGSDHQYKHTITGLTPGSKYCYKITVGTGFAAGTFTAAPASSATDVKFLMFGDTRTNPGSMAQVTAAMNNVIASDPDYQTLCLLSGDWVTTGEDESEWTTEYFNRSYTESLDFQASVAINGCRGNHEGAANIYQKYLPFPYVNPCYFSFDYGPVHVAVVDQYISYNTGSAQNNWLINDLSNTIKPFKIVMYHEPAWGAGTHSNDTTTQTDIHPVCVQYGVQMCVNGHNHNYVRAEVDGIRHITSGGGGAGLYDVDLGDPYVVTATKALNFQTVEIVGNTMTVKSYDPDMTVLDSFQASGGSTTCGDDTCEGNENQCNCPEDCGTPPSTETSCTDGEDNDCDNYTDCADADCDSDPACQCGNGTCDPGEDCTTCPDDCISRTTPPKFAYCCGDGTCEGEEDEINCAVDCGGAICGDETCDPGEDQCNCPDDCGTPPSTETSCTDEVDNDCDTDVDCDDSDCIGDPACPTCGDETCDPGEDQCNCPDDCGTPPSTETSCTDEVDNDCDTYVDCDDPDCDGDPACPDCGERGDPCTEDADCCSNDCNTGRGICK